MKNTKLFIFGSILAFSAQLSQAENLEQYAQKCDAEIGVTVPAFKCDEGSVVPGNIANSSGMCDTPAFLGGHGCSENSTIKVIHNSDDAYIVASCRWNGSAYNDIAVIQHNKNNGATCFYQALGSLPNSVPTPSNGTGGFWETPAGTAGINCVACHDNGPILRTPYMAAIETGPDIVPGKGALSGFNDHDSPYRFVGDDFQQWEVFDVDAANGCTSCHRMAVSATDGVLNQSRGAALDWGPKSVGLKPMPFMIDPIWMFPGIDSSNSVSVAAAQNLAQDLKDCAELVNPSLSGIQTPIAGCTVKRVPSIATKNLKAMTDGRAHRLMYGSSCIDIRGSESSPSNTGASVISWSCHGGVNQKWFLDSERNIVGGNGQCLTATGGGTDQVVLTTECDGSASQKWTIAGDIVSGGEVRNDLGKCLELIGNTLYARPCTSGSLQQFSYKRDESINIQVTKYSKTDPSFCLDLSGGADDEGTDIDGYWCDARGNQQWSLIHVGNNEYQMLSSHTGKCGAYENGRLKQYTCIDDDAQKFTLESHLDSKFNIKSAESNLCLSYQYPSSVVGFYNCNSSDPRQRWFESDY